MGKQLRRISCVCIYAMLRGIYKSYRTESITKSTLTFVTGVIVSFKVFPFRVYSTGPTFLPLLKAPLELTFWNRISGTYRSRCLRSCSSILGNKNRAQIRTVVMGWGWGGVGRNHSHAFSAPKFTASTRRRATETQTSQSFRNDTSLRPFSLQRSFLAFVSRNRLKKSCVLPILWRAQGRLFFYVCHYFQFHMSLRVVTYAHFIGLLFIIIFNSVIVTSSHIM